VPHYYADGAEALVMAISVEGNPSPSQNIQA
jgi:hypothetical protein